MDILWGILTAIGLLICMHLIVVGIAYVYYNHKDKKEQKEFEKRMEDFKKGIY